MADPIELLERGISSADRVVAGVRPEQLTDSTPCTEWTVRDLMNHMVGGNLMFGQCASGEGSAIDPFGPPQEFLGDDPHDAYQRSAKAALDGWRTPGALEGTVTLPVGEAPGQRAIMIHLADTLAHTWDLARATGQRYEPDTETVDTAFDAIYGGMPDAARGPGKAFQAEVQIDETAPKIERLVAYLGRKV